MENIVNVTAIWRGKKYVVEMTSDATLKDLGDELQKLTDIKEDTMKFIVPQVENKSSNLLYPFSNEHSLLSLEEAAITEGNSIRMMGVSEDEVEKVLQNAKVNQRIAGFEEEKKRLRQRISDRPAAVIKLPTGPYIFCDFRTLELPGIELNPPASKALRLMHLLAADPGIAAIMNKHRWRVGIMTEMAPVGYVGVSPKCILGFNKNHGEEISLRLRTDDLKGFRKYESIKKTLLHELAHMVFSEHDENFYALDKQLNQEANNLDWTKSKGRTVSGVRHQEYYEEDFDVDDDNSFSQKLGGNVLDPLASARESSVTAAYRRLANIASNSSGALEVDEEPVPDDSKFTMNDKDNEDVEILKRKEHENYVMGIKNQGEPDPDDSQSNTNQCEPDPDDSQSNTNHYEPDPDDSQSNTNRYEPDPDDSQSNTNQYESDPDDSQDDHPQMTGPLNKYEPDPDDTQDNNLQMPRLQYRNKSDLVDTRDNDFVMTENKCEPDPDDSLGGQKIDTLNGGFQLTKSLLDEPDPDEAEVEHQNLEVENMETKDYPIEAFKEPNRDDAILASQEVSDMQLDVPSSDDREIQRIQDPVTIICGRLNKAIEALQAELNPTDATMTLQTIFRIIRNVIDRPDETKFRRLRKANPTIQKNVVNCKAAMEILQMVGFSDDVVFDELGRSETYLVLKRNDPGLLWLAKSSIESAI